MLELNDVGKKVGDLWHLRDISLQLEAGILNVLLGPTLSGKTTLMRLMAGLDKPTSGSMTFNNKNIVGVPVRKRNVAMVYQQFINYPAFTVYENIASPLRILGANTTTIDTEVRKAAELLKLTDYLDRTPLQLSGGQQQRTAIARALVKKADLVLLDEPLANLDYKLREDLRIELPKIFAQTGAVFVYATTEPQEALLLGGKTATLDKGRLTQFGDTIEVYRQPQDLITAKTFADPPLNIAQVENRQGKLFAGAEAFGQAPSNGLSDGHYTVAIRAHHIALQQSDTHKVPVQVKVGTSEITGSESFLHIQMHEQPWVVLTQGIHRVEKHTGTTVYLDPSTYYMFDQNERLVYSPSQTPAPV